MSLKQDLITKTLIRLNFGFQGSEGDNDRFWPNAFGPTAFGPDRFWRRPLWPAPGLTAFGPHSFWPRQLLARSRVDRFWPRPLLAQTFTQESLFVVFFVCFLFHVFSNLCSFPLLSVFFFPQLFDGCDISGEKIIFLSRLAEEARKRPHRPTKENHKPGNDVEIEDKASEHVINDLWFEARINNPRTRLPERCMW